MLNALRLETISNDPERPEPHSVGLAELSVMLGYASLTAGDASESADARFRDIQEQYWARSANATLQRAMRLAVDKPQAPAPRAMRKDGERPLRILQGVTGQANQPETLARALRSLGHHAHSCTAKPHPFAYAVTHPLQLSSAPDLGPLVASVTHLAESYDIFHFHARSFANGWLPYPALLDMLWLKASGKKVFFHYRGSEIRDRKIFEQNNPWHFRADEAEALATFTRIPDEVRRLLRCFVDSVCDGVFVVDEEIKSYVGNNSIIVPRAVDDADLDCAQTSSREVPVIVHAPTRREVKGTEYVIAAVERLRSRGILCELRLVEGMKHDDALKAYRDADIVVDQLRVGWYGVLSVEAMALGKPVVCCIRPDLWQRHGADLPLANANPDTLEAELELLLRDPAERQRLGGRGRDYFLRAHRAVAVAERLEGLYRMCDRPPQDIDWIRVLRLVDWEVKDFARRHAAKLEMSLAKRHEQIIALTERIKKEKEQAKQKLKNQKEQLLAKQEKRLAPLNRKIAQQQALLAAQKNQIDELERRGWRGLRRRLSRLWRTT